jgi:hypothetical protein
MPESPKDLLDLIQANGQHVRAAATDLTNRIKSFEAWLMKRPGRVAVSCVVGTDQHGEREDCLAFERVGKEWALVVFTYLPQHNARIDELLLRDAPIETKTWMITFFPKLLEEFARRQEDVVKRARESANLYDNIARSFGIKEGE